MKKRTVCRNKKEPESAGQKPRARRSLLVRGLEMEWAVQWPLSPRLTVAEVSEDSIPLPAARVHTYVMYICIRMYVVMYVCMYVCMYTYVHKYYVLINCYVCMYVCMYTYVHKYYVLINPPIPYITSSPLCLLRVFTSCLNFASWERPHKAPPL